MVRLQELYDRIAEAIRERQSPPVEVRELQQANLDRQAELETIEEQVQEHDGGAQVPLHEEGERQDQQAVEAQGGLPPGAA